MIRNSKGQFTPETYASLTQEEKLLRSRAMIEAVKKRPDYIGDLKNKHQRIFNCWRAILYTEKGQKAGCCQEWRDFRVFFNDVFPSYEKGKLLRRKDATLEWSPSNFIWTTAEEIGLAKASVSLEYQGEVRTIREWADILNVPYKQMYQRYVRAKDDTPVEHIIFGTKKARGTKAPKDYSDPHVNMRGKASKMLSSYRHIDIVNNTEQCDMSIDWLIDNILTQACHYCGDTRRIGCDRIDNDRGHTKDNVVPCCIECNTARNKFFTYQEMKRLGRAIAEIKKDRQL